MTSPTHAAPPDRPDSDELVLTWLQDVAALTLGSSEWEGIASQRLVDVRTGDVPRWPTTVKLVGTSHGLWIRFACAAGTIRATLTQYKDKVWQEDAVEVYLQPPGALPMYEFQLSPIGTYRDLRVVRPSSAGRSFDDTWSCAGLATTAVVDRDDRRKLKGWRAMFGIPWRGIASAGQAETGWRIALFRIERDPLEYSGLRSYPIPDLDLHDDRFLTRLVFPSL